MSEGPDQDGDQTSAVTARPYVDGRAASSEELRAEVERELDPRQAQVDRVRTELAETVSELTRRVDVRPRMSDLPARARSIVIVAGAALSALVGIRLVLSRRRSRASR